MSYNVSKSKFNRNDLKDIIVKVIRASKKKSTSDPLTSASSAHNSGLLVKRDGLEFKVTDNSKEVDKTSFAEFQYKEQRTIEIDNGSSAAIEQNLSVIGNKEKMALQDDSKRSENVIRPIFNDDDLKQIRVNTTWMPKEKLIDIPLINASSINNSGHLVKRDEDLEYKIIKNSKEIGKSSVAASEYKEMCIVDEEQRMRETGIRNFESTERNLSVERNKEMDAVQDESKRSQDVPIFNHDIKQIITNLTQMSKDKVTVDPLIVAYSIHNPGQLDKRQVVEYMIVDNSKELIQNTVAQYEDKEMCYVDEEQRMREIGFWVSESTKNLSLVEYKEKETVQTESMKSQNFRPIVIHDDLKQITENMILIPKKKLDVVDPLIVASCFHNSGPLCEREEFLKHSMINNKSDEVNKNSVAKGEDVDDCSLYEEHRTKERRISSKSTRQSEQNLRMNLCHL